MVVVMKRVAKLYTDFLRDSNYDVVSIENARDKYGKNNFNHEFSKIITVKKISYVPDMKCL